MSAPMRERARKWLDAHAAGSTPTEEDVDDLAELLAGVHGEGRHDASRVVRRVLTVLEMVGLDADALFWTDGPSANCNDLFAWACSDEEPITEDNVELFARTLKECEVLGEASWGLALFACRSRGRRPQAPVYRSMPVSLVPLFDAVSAKGNAQPGARR